MSSRGDDQGHRLSPPVGNIGPPVPDVAGLSRHEHPDPREARQAEIIRLREEHASALSVGMLSEGTISAFQMARMSKAARRTWETRVAERFDVEAQIRELGKTDEQIAREAAEKMSAEHAVAIAREQSDIRLWRSMGTDRKTGKVSKSYQKCIDRAVARLAAMGVGEEGGLG